MTVGQLFSFKNRKILVYLQCLRVSVREARQGTGDVSLTTNQQTLRDLCRCLVYKGPGGEPLSHNLNLGLGFEMKVARKVWPWQTCGEESDRQRGKDSLLVTREVVCLYHP